MMRAGAGKNSGGYILLPTVIAFSVTVLALTAMFVAPVHKTYSLIYQRVRFSSARYLADAGAAKALREIEKSGPGFTGKGFRALPTGSTNWEVKTGKNGKLLVTATGEHNLPGPAGEIMEINLVVSVSEETGGKYKIEILSTARDIRAE